MSAGRSQASSRNKKFLVLVGVVQIVNVAALGACAWTYTHRPGIAPPQIAAAADPQTSGNLQSPIIEPPVVVPSPAVVPTPTIVPTPTENPAPKPPEPNDTPTIESPVGPPADDPFPPVSENRPPVVILPPRPPEPEDPIVTKPRPPEPLDEPEEFVSTELPPTVETPAIDAKSTKAPCLPNWSTTISSLRESIRRRRSRADAALPSPTPDLSNDPPTKQPTIINETAKAGFPVTFTVNGEIVTLAPGESRELPGGDSWVVAFDRGGNFGEARVVLYTGSHRFDVSSQGWQLIDVEDPQVVNSEEGKVKR